ncbi:MAG TPA: hypothetical protein VK721_02845 [Solirubrobacteraceae bacterium]|jgi:hypothetical protein|nr:hypothetical protein [Solirubrobacteraceae bacterium]
MAVTDDPRSRRNVRARPVVDLPTERLLAGAGELARRWVVALILSRPLEDVAAVPLETLVDEAPTLCAQVIRALESDLELDRLTGRAASGGRTDAAAARRLPVICGALDDLEALDAVEALRGVLWEALREELREPAARLVGDACDRLAYVCAETLAAALEAMPALGAGRVRDGERERAGAEAGTEAGLRDLHAPAAGAQSGALRAPGEAVIVDERMAPVAASFAGEPVRSREAPASLAPDAPAVEIAIRDERREEGPAAWIGLIGAQLERFERDRAPFAVLLVELVDIERLQRPDHVDDLARKVIEMERALTGALGAWAGSFTRERPGRCWLVAPETDLVGAELLAERLARAVAARATHRGGSLALAIGTAVCPEQGREASALAAHADVGSYAARSRAHAPAGPSVAGRGEPR